MQTKNAQKIESESESDSNQENGCKSIVSWKAFTYAEPLDYFLMSVGVLSSVVTGVSLPVFNILFGQMINTLNTDPNSFSDEVDKTCIYMVIVAGANIVAGFAQIYCWTMTGERQTQKFREKYVNAILSQEIGWFDNCGANELASNVPELIGKVSNGTGRRLGDFFQFAAQCISAFVVSFYFSWKLALVMMVALPMITICAAILIRTATAAQNKAADQYSAAGGLAIESINSIRTVTALNMQPYVITKYRKYLFEAMRNGIDTGFSVGLGLGGLFCAIFCTYALGFWYGGNIAADDLQSRCTGNGCLSGGDVISCFNCIITGSFGLGQAVPPLTAFLDANVAIERLFQIILRTPLIDGLSWEGLCPNVNITGAICFENLHFAYPARPTLPICQDYSLSIAPGETIALVGASGSGKSTIINLLLRFYDPQSGTITLDGYELKRLNIQWLRSQFGYVGQEPVLFGGTIGENIAYGLQHHEVVTDEEEKRNQVVVCDEETLQHPDADDYEQKHLLTKVVEAAKAANAHDFITSFPQGYDTDVGSNGAAMSGGQKQRIAIARALIKKPAVLLLDEATSALDAASERIVQQSIDALTSSKAQTTIIIAHRLSTIRNADKIVMMEQGRIVEIGTHDELIRKENGKYADLVRLQLISAAEEEEEDIAVVPDDINEHDKESHTSVESTEFAEEEAGIVQAAKELTTISLIAQQDCDDVEEANKKIQMQQQQQQIKNQQFITSKIHAMIFSYPKAILYCIIGGMCFGSVFPLWGYMVGKSYAMFYEDHPATIREKADTYSIVFASFGVASLIFSTLAFYGNAIICEQIASRLRSEMFEALMRHEIGFFDHEHHTAGALTSQLAQDALIIHKGFADLIAKRIQAIFIIVVGVIIAFNSSWKMTLVVIACFPLVVSASIVRNRARGGQHLQSEKTENPHQKLSIKDTTNSVTHSTPNSGTTVNAITASTLISTAFIHMRTISAFSMQHQVSQQYMEITQKAMVERISDSIPMAISIGLSNSAHFFVYSLVFWYGSQLLQYEHLAFSDMIIAMMTLLLGVIGLGVTLRDKGDQNAAMEAAERAFQLIEAGEQSKIDGVSIQGITPSQHAKGKIELKNVTFHYPTRSDVEVCKGYDLTIEAGQTVALVGPSGSGKSTIINLLLRFYDPNQGKILLDDQPINTLNVRWLRSQIGHVGQEPILFAGSVTSNIRHGRCDGVEEAMMPLTEALQAAQEEYAATHPRSCSCCCGNQRDKLREEGGTTSDADSSQDIEHGKALFDTVDDEIVDACRAANAHDFIISFPQGYDTDVGEGSIMVSGGQKQRIAIARALIKKPAVLLLDEATSALDAASERIVQQSIDALTASKAQTTIIIAHRLSTIQNVDKIVVVDHGRIVEIGTHDALLQKDGGLYRALWYKQSKHKN